jgi:hypothetical protein
VAAGAAEVVRFDLERTAIAVKLPPRGRKQAVLKIRNWSPQPRKWAAAADQPWIVPDKRGGAVTGQAEMVVTLDAAKLGDARQAKGTLRITDASEGGAGTVCPVAVSVTMPPVLTFRAPDAGVDRTKWPNRYRFIQDVGKVPFNVPLGGSETQTIMFTNEAAEPVAWRLTASAPWVMVAPGSGGARPRSPVLVKVTAAPPAKVAGRHDVSLAAREDGGSAGVDIPLAVYVMPPYHKPTKPAGQAVPIGSAKGIKLLRFRGRSEHFWIETRKNQKHVWVRGKEYPWLQAAVSPGEAVYRIEGDGYSAFSAEVAIPDRPYGWRGKAPDWVRLNFEIWVDGGLRAQSGFMGPKDPARLLVVEGLAGAKELRLVTRLKRLTSNALTGVWLVGTFYK